MDRVIEKGKGETCDEEVYNLSESSDEFVKDVNFNDSGEERTKGFYGKIKVKCQFSTYLSFSLRFSEISKGLKTASATD